MTASTITTEQRFAEQYERSRDAALTAPDGSPLFALFDSRNRPLTDPQLIVESTGERFMVRATVDADDIGQTNVWMKAGFKTFDEAFRWLCENFERDAEDLRSECR